MNELIVLKLNRLLAAFIDGLALFILFFAAFTYPLIEMILMIKQGIFSGQIISLAILSAVVGLFLGVLYLFITSAIFKGATLGMKIMHLTFVKTDGSIPKKVSLFNRAVSIVLCNVLTLGFSIIIDVVCLLLNDMGKNFHDIYSNMKVEGDYVY